MVLGSDLAGSIGEPPRRVGQNGLESSFHCRKWSDFRRGSQSLGHSLDVPEIDLVCHPWVFYADGYRSRPMSSSRTAGSSTLGAGWTGADRTPPLHPEATVPPPQAGTFRAAGCGPLQPGTARAYGDRIPVPDGVEGPRPRRHVPGRAGCPHPRRVSPDARRTPARAVGPDHEGGHSHRPSLRRTSGGRHAALPNHHGPASDTNKRAPHLRCGAAGVCAPVQARCSLSGEDCSRHPPTPQPQRVVIGRPRLVGYFCPIPHPDDEEADCE